MSTDAEGDEVLIVGGGPVGLTLALGLAHHGVRSTVIERDLTTPRGSRAFGIWGRTLEILEDWGLVEPFLAEGDRRARVAPADIRTERPIFSLDFSPLEAESAMPGIVLLPQASTERLLRDAITAEPLATVVGAECLSARDEGDHVVAVVRDDAGVRELRGSYLVAADGSRSVVREGLGMRHRGQIITVNLLVFDVELEDGGLEPIRIDPTRRGLLAALRFEPGRWRVLMTMPSDPVPVSLPTEGPPPRRPDVPVEELAPAVNRLFGERAHRVTWQSQTTLYQQAVPRFRVGRIVLAGDSAHLISPAGGQGMNQGLQDAENLAWTLAAVVEGADPDLMLDGYDRERRDIATAVRRRAYLNSLLEFRTPVWTRPAAFWAMRILLRSRTASRLLTRRLSMRDLRYRSRHSGRLLGGGWWGARRAVGRRVPDAVLRSGERLASLLGGRAAVVGIGVDPPAIDGLATVVVDSGEARRGLRRSLRRGHVLLVRPDRHVAAVLRGPTAADLAAAARATGLVP
ncbi:12-dehydrotetracycline 5-monooxygenase/anhydrotetracycline 6-monooxygenase [Demequina sediminis]|uniref:12-dehydrotetracycline 5-monooxygenase/anhydrotetracycline 6-monooxygenase n=1 Tax=Demequina sediminis TaxID=1930058 RepID=A0ABP9WHD1_9MICO|nr:FAD-dependent monooxygenase [Demequina sediminis]BDZ62270.1 putative aromatic compound monooxygenase YhjG [Demequina sediminis]